LKALGLWIFFSKNISDSTEPNHIISIFHNLSSEILNYIQKIVHSLLEETKAYAAFESSRRMISNSLNNRETKCRAPSAIHVPEPEDGMFPVPISVESALEWQSTALPVVEQVK
jgi:hypothetical protein